MFTYMRPVWAVRGVWEIYKRTFNWISKSRYLGLQTTKTHREYPETALDRPWSEFRNFPLRTHVCHLHVFGQSSLVVCYPALENIGIDGLLKPVFKMVVFWSIDGSCPFRDLPEQNQSGVNEQCPGLLLKETYGWASSVCNGLCQIDYTPKARIISSTTMQRTYCCCTTRAKLNSRNRLETWKWFPFCMWAPPGLHWLSWPSTKEWRKTASHMKNVPLCSVPFAFTFNQHIFP